MQVSKIQTNISPKYTKQYTSMPNRGSVGTNKYTVSFNGRIHDAIKNNEYDIFLEEIAKDPAVVNDKDSDNWQRTPLYTSIVYNRWDVFCELLKRKEVNINDTNEDGDTPLICASRNNDTEYIKELLKRNDIDVNIKNKYGNTALMEACLRDKNEAAKMLLERMDVDINTKGDMDFTPLFTAIERGNKELADALLNRNDMDINVHSYDGNTPLMVYSRYIDYKKLLSHPNVDINITNKAKETPLIHACANGGCKRALSLLECPDIKVNKQDTRGRTALIWACIAECYSGMEPVIEKLIDHPDINLIVEDKDGMKALDYADARHNNLKLPANLYKKLKEKTEAQLADPKINGFKQISVNIEKLDAENSIWSGEEITSKFINLVKQKKFDSAGLMLERTPMIDLSKESGVIKTVGASENEELMEKLFDYKFHKQANMKASYDEKRKNFIKKLEKLPYNELKQKYIALNSEDGFAILVNHPEFNPNDKIDEVTLFEIACSFGTKYPFAKDMLAKYPNIDTSNKENIGNITIKDWIDEYETTGKYKLWFKEVENALFDNTKQTIASEYLKNFLEIKDFKPYLTDELGNTILHLAAILPDDSALGLIQKALDKGINLNAKNVMGQTPLMAAVKSLIKITDEYSRTSILSNINFLLNKGANIDTQDNNGQTAFHFACLTTSAALLALLLRKNPNVLLIDKNGNRAFKYLKTQEMKDIYQKYIMG